MTTNRLSKSDFAFRAFLSYSHQDRKWARWLFRKLERYRVPKRLVGLEGAHGPVDSRLSPIFRDREELASGADLSKNIVAALQNSEALILIVSPASAKSKWVNEEVLAFKRSGRSDRIFTFVVGGDPGAREGPDVCFPEALLWETNEQGERLGPAPEPIGADARETGDGRKRALGKLIAGLLGVRYSELERREVHRRNQRLMAITVASLAGLVITGGLAVSAYLSRQDAERRRAQAEGLLGFMVGDMRESLEPLGRLDLLSKVGDEAMAYFSTVEPGDLTDEGLSRQAQVLTQIGEVSMSQARYEQALTSFKRAYDRSAELVARHENDGSRLFDRGQAEFWIGYVAWEKGEVEDARQWFERYLNTSETLVQQHPGNIDWTIELAYAQSNLATLELKHGNLQKAADSFDQQSLVWSGLDCSEPRCDDIKFELADVYTWQGLTALRQGRLEATWDAFDNARTVYGALVEHQPDNKGYLFEFADETNNSGLAAYWLGEKEVAAERLTAGMDLLNQLSLHDPSNQVWQLHAIKSRLNLALLETSIGSEAAVTGLLHDIGLKIAEASALDPPLAGLVMSQLRFLRIRLQLAVDAMADLSDLLEERAILDRLIPTSSEDDQMHAHQEQVMIDVLLARNELNSGDFAAASAQARQIMNILQGDMQRSMHPRVTEPWVRAWQLLPESDRTAEDLDTLETIQNTGLAIPGLWPED